MPVTSSTFPALPPQPSWRIRAMISRIGMSRCDAFALVPEIIRSLPHRSQVMRRNQDGKALNGSLRASLPVGGPRVGLQPGLLAADRGDDLRDSDGRGLGLLAARRALRPVGIGDDGHGCPDIEQPERRNDQPCAVPPGSRLIGIHSETVVPMPCSVWMSKAPPDCSTNPFAIARPNPVPSFISLVE
jgi:hypothetical protein